MAGDGSDLSPPGSMSPPRNPQVRLQPACCAAHLKLQILQKPELGSRSPPFVRLVLGFELCDEC